MLKHFVITLLPEPPDDKRPKDAGSVDQLRLVPRPQSKLAKQIEFITLMVDRQTDLPVLVTTREKHDVEKTALEVQEYTKAVSYIAQTGLRDTIGKHDLADLLQNREKIADALQGTLDEHTNPWGITCQTVGIKDIVIPETAIAGEKEKRKNNLKDNPPII